MFRQEILHTSKCKQYSQQKIIKWTRREFKGDITYFTTNDIVPADGSSQKSNEAIVVKLN